MDELLGQAIPALERSLAFRVARQGLLAANLANVDTPGYRRVDLRFEAELEGARARLARTDPSHLSGSQSTEKGHRLVTGPRSPRPDGNGVELERELIAASRNAGAFTRNAAVLSRLLAIQRLAVVGQAR